MNRKERRRSAKDARGRSDQASHLVELGTRSLQQGNAREAATLYEQAIAADPNFAKAHNNLGTLMLAQGKRKHAAAAFARTFTLEPELYEAYGDVCSLLIALNPGLREGISVAMSAWPRLPSAEELLGPPGLRAVPDLLLLDDVLQQATVRDLPLERFLTALRASLLAATVTAHDRVDDGTLGFLCALARQCFINEYVFACSAAELEQVARLSASVVDGLANGGVVPPPWVAAMACYAPLGSLAGAQALLERRWPPAVEGVLTQQLREPGRERQLRDSIPRLTAIEDGVSLRVQQQYEENPYPRWVLPAPQRAEQVTVDEYLRRQFSESNVRQLGRDRVDMLIAGCGTGYHPIAAARRYRGVRITAIDLSLSSLCYAKRKTEEARVSGIDYEQADILQLGSIGRTFDVIDSQGVLHHLADPFAAWSVLLELLRPGGLMYLGLYSRLARRDIYAARDFIAAKGYRPTPDDIRRCRQDLMVTPLSKLARIYDFFSMSNCRDMLFHVEENPVTLAEIAAFVERSGLRLVGFETSAAVRALYRARFPMDRAMTDLQSWHQLESERPDLFLGMYLFWVQKT
jgi:SAM-dependent methyltransferase